MFHPKVVLPIKQVSPSYNHHKSTIIVIKNVIEGIIMRFTKKAAATFVQIDSQHSAVHTIHGLKLSFTIIPHAF